MGALELDVAWNGTVQHVAVIQSSAAAEEAASALRVGSDPCFVGFDTESGLASVGLAAKARPRTQGPFMHIQNGGNDSMHQQ